MYFEKYKLRGAQVHLAKTFLCMTFVKCSEER